MLVLLVRIMEQGTYAFYCKAKKNIIVNLRSHAITVDSITSQYLYVSAVAIHQRASPNHCGD